MSSANEIRLLGTRLSTLDTRALLRAIEERLRTGTERITVASGNAHSFNLAHALPWFRDFLNRADLVRLDGAGLRLGARLLGHRLPPRSTWADFGWELAAFCETKGYSLFLFGGRPGIAEEAAAAMLRRHPALNIAGTAHGFIDLSADAPQHRELVRRINSSGASILIVGLGMPLQERWLAEHRDRLRVPVVMTGGAVFDYLSGRKRRAPHWMLNCGLEWLYRLLQEPRRLWRRYLVGNPRFIARVLRERRRRAAGAGDSIALMGVRVRRYTAETLEAEILASVRGDKRVLFPNVNLHAMNIAWREPWFRDFLNASGRVFCDGQGVLVAARLLRRPLPARITYADWLPRLAAMCAREGLSLYLLGARPGVAEDAADRLKRQLPALRVAGTHHGYFDRTAGSTENEAVVDDVRRSRPDLLLVGFGMPLQERWLAENWDRLEVRVGLTVGAAFEYAAGTLRRAPAWMTAHGLEWLGRLFIEPRKLWRRYLIGGPVFFARLLAHSLGRQPRPAAGSRGPRAL